MADPATLYPAVLREVVRVLRPAGRAVLMVSEDALDLMRELCSGAQGCGLRLLCIRAVPLGLLAAAIVVTERAEAGSAGSAELEVARRLPWETSEGRAGWDAMRKRGRPPLVPAALSRVGTSAGAK